MSAKTTTTTTTLAKRISYIEASGNVLFGTAIWLAPQLLLPAVVPAKDRATVITPLAEELFGWTGLFVACFNGVLFLRSLWSCHAPTEKIVQEVHLLADVLYVGTISLWVYRTEYYMAGNIMNIVYGVFLFGARVKRVLELTDELKQEKSD
mmetsp:Transcript_46128/g.112765  ORF Transcript_46128/g.112765 Transcript_46128/m.112765 type:complete len:151 (-) Transcript_46128:1034-1486(-)